MRLGLGEVPHSHCVRGGIISSLYIPWILKKAKQMLGPHFFFYWLFLSLFCCFGLPCCFVSPYCVALLLHLVALPCYHTLLHHFVTLHCFFILLLYLVASLCYHASLFHLVISPCFFTLLLCIALQLHRVVLPYFFALLSHLATSPWCVALLFHFVALSCCHTLLRCLVAPSSAFMALVVAFCLFLCIICCSTPWCY